MRKKCEEKKNKNEKRCYEIYNDDHGFNNMI